jgi:phosphoribosylamine---glycine ligase
LPMEIMAERVLTVGGGGREHAIVDALARAGADVCAVMKNRNPGIARLAKELLLIKETDVGKVVQFAKDRRVGLAVIGPEAPLEAGLSDALRGEGVEVVGPSKRAARMETDKGFARTLLAKYKVPGNLRFGVFDDLAQASKFAKEAEFQLAVKPVGLTCGKGVKVEGEQLKDKGETLAYIKEIFDRSIGGAGVVLEEKIVGEEFTLQAFVDGARVIPMPLVQDHKRAFEGDLGPNTGGMGSYSLQDHLLPFVAKEDLDQAMESISRTVEALRGEDCVYQGVLYGQFMLTSKGPRIIEFNARFGDPEAMNVLPLLDSGFVEICHGIAEGNLSSSKVSFANMATVCKYVVPAGYGIEPKANLPIEVDEEAAAREGARIFYAAVNEENGRITTSSSRSVGVVGIAPDLERAEANCERALKHVKGEAIYVRHDIGRKEIIEKKVARMRLIRG